ncbi:MAG TPA: PAS domain S-box protein [Usitatibacter sp.]|nr:PAS domain S-box protein [Usitatibacter sp.]
MSAKPGVPISAAPIPSSWQDEPYRRMVETIRDYAVFLLDTEGHVASWNLGAERIKGYRPEEIIGRHFSTFYPQSAIDRGWPQHELETAARVGRFEDEGWRLRKDGTNFWANVVITAIRNEEGQLLGFSKVTRDLTERRMNEERLRVSEERFRMMIEGVRDYAIFLLDPAGYVVTWNAGAQRIKGYAPDEIIGKHFSQFYPAEALERNWPQQELQEALRLGRFEDEGWRLRKDGSRFWANVVLTPLRDRDGVHRGFSKITRDLTERREQEERMRQSEERFRLLLEGVEDYAIYLLDPDGRVSSWNGGAQRIMGYTAGEIVGQSFERFYPPEDVVAGRPTAELRTAALNRRAEDTGWRMRKDGTRFWANVVVTALHDDEGRLRGFAKVTRDLSERKRIEDLEEQGRHLTEFLAMLAHELRNPLAPIRNALGIMALSPNLAPQAAWSRDVIERQTTQLTRLVDDLLDVSRITRGKLSMHTATMDVNVAVQRAVEAARPLLDSRKHGLEVTLAPKAIVVNGDLTRVIQVLVNLLNNAAKYTPEGGRISVAVHSEAHDAVIRVTDNGIGIPPHMIEHVFDLFAQGERSLARTEGGLGIGLTLARRIVALHGGSIKARSAGASQGSEFVVRLPLLPDYAASLPALPDRKPGEPVRKRSVVVVEDNADAAESMAMLLRAIGHDVRVQLDGTSALEEISARMPDVVLLDIGLPGLNGYEVARRLREHPGGEALRIYALTGYGQEDDRRRSLQAGFDGHLVKPVIPSDLFALVDAQPARH